MAKRITTDERQRATEENHSHDHDVVVMPKYKKDARLGIDKEYNIPPAELYIPLGWDEDATTKRKHYRHYEPDELENSADVFPNGPSPFHSYNVIKGQTRGMGPEGGLFSFSHSPKDESG